MDDLGSRGMPSQTGPAAAARRSAHIAPDTRGQNYFTLDHSLLSLLPLYMPADLLAHLRPHLDALGALAGGRLGELADAADRHGPVLHPRDRFGRDEEWIEFPPRLPRHGGDRLRALRPARHDPSRRRAGMAGAAAPRSPNTSFIMSSPRRSSACSARST